MILNHEIPILKSVIPITLGTDNLLLEGFQDITPLKEIQFRLEKSETKAKKLYKEANFYKNLFAHDIYRFRAIYFKTNCRIAWWENMDGFRREK